MKNNKKLLRIKNILSVDFRRMLTTSLFYIMVGISIIIPILVLVMTSTMGGTSVDPNTGTEIVVETFTNVWQTIGSVSNAEQGGMSIISMCNINLVYFLIAIFVSLFVCADFKSGYSKNIFTMHSKKTNYILSKIIVGFFAGMVMILGYFVGSMLGGAIAGLSFDTTGFGVTGIVMCIISKIFITSIFVSIAVTLSSFAKDKTWMSILGSCCAGMLLFMMIPLITPLDSTIINVILSFVGGILFSIGMMACSNQILKRSGLV